MDEVCMAIVSGHEPQQHTLSPRFLILACAASTKAHLYVLTQEAAKSTVVMQAGESIVIDPSFREEAAACGAVTVIVNTNSNVCTVRKTSGVGIPLAQVCAGSVL